MRAIVVSLVILLGLIAPPPRAVRAADPATPTLAFRRLLINTGGERSEACFRFDKALATDAPGRYAEHLRIEPTVMPALRVEKHDLCVGNLAFGSRYRITLLSGLAGADGSRLRSDVMLSVGLGDRPSTVAIAGDGFILPRATAHGLVVATVNVARVRLHVYRMSPDAAAVRTTPSTGDAIDLTTTSLPSYQFTNLLEHALVPVWHGTMDIAPDPNRTVETAFPLAGLIGGSRPGLFLVVAEDAARALPPDVFDPATVDNADTSRWPSGGMAAHWVDVTNIGLTSFSGSDGLHVFARALDTARPLAGVRLELRATGQDLLATATTDGTGGAVFPPGVSRGRAAEAPASVSAALATGAGATSATGTGATGTGADDTTMLRLDRAAFDFSDRGADGAAPPGPAQAVLITDRGIYRPGETVNVTALLRDDGGSAIATERLTLVLHRPDGVEASRITVGAVAGGGWAVPLRLTASAALGQWRVDALTDPTAKPVGTASFSVQDFVPQLLAVTLHPGAPAVRTGEPVHATLDGRFLYGAPAAGLHGQGELRVERDPDPVPGFKNYSWGLAGEAVDSKTVTIDVPPAAADGTAAVDATPDIPPGLTTPLHAVLTAGLFEPGGRIVSDSATLPVLGTRPLIGLKPIGTPGAGDSDTASAPVAIATATADRKPAAFHALQWSVIRENRVYDWFEDNGSWTFHYHVIDEPVSNGTVDTGADGRGRIAPVLDWGEYRVVVTDGASGATSSVPLDVGWDSADTGPDAPDRIPVTVRDPVVAAGGATVVHVAAPFAGHALLVIAGSRVFETRELDVPRGGLDVPVIARPEWGTGAYALVTLYRPLDGTARPHDPVRAVGLAWIGLDHGARTLSVSLGAPPTVRPRLPLLVPVTVHGGKAGEQVRLTLAAVDEGILQLTRYTLPDPVAILFGKRALGLDMRDDYGRLLDGGAPAGMLHEGGDEGGGGAGLPVVSSKIVSLWSGTVALDGQGRGTIALDVPDFEGQLRLMAIAWSPSAVGSASADTTVRDPVFADVALPRFLAPGDAARIAVSVANTEAPAGRFHVALRASGAVRLDGPNAFDATLATGARTQFAPTLDGVADGVGTVTATLTPGDGGAPLARTWSIAVRSAHAPEVNAVSAEQRPGESWQPDPHALSAFEPGSGSVVVGFSGFAGIDTVGLLQSLGGDDWNCSEQLASTAWPLLFFNDPALLGPALPEGGARARVQRAIDTLIDREDPAGRFGLWRVGDGAATPWLDVYIVDFLEHAGENGFSVPEAALGRALDWLDAEQVQGFGDFDRDQHVVPETRAYALYVLARAGRASPLAVRRMHDDAYVQTDPGDVKLVFWSSDADAAGVAEASALGHLAAGLQLTGDDRAAADTFDMAVDNLGSIRTGRASWFDLTYWSYVRDLATVATLSAEAGDDRRAQELIDRFGLLDLTAPKLTDGEKAALLGAAHALDRDKTGRQLSLNGHPTASTLHLPAAFTPDPAALGQPYSLSNTGTLPLWRTVTVTGVPSGPVAAASHGFTLDRQFLDVNGKPVDPAHLRQNDRVLVVLHGNAADDDDHRVALVDRLPAALEIESPVRSPDTYKFLGALTRPRAIEGRDDRFFAAFDLGGDLDPPQWREENDSNDDNGNNNNDDDSDRSTLDAGEFRVAYVARVVTPGHFTVPEAIVRDMYRPTDSARTASSVTDVAPAH